MINLPTRALLALELGMLSMPSVDIIPGSYILYCHLRPVLLHNYNIICLCTADGYWNPIPMMLALCNYFLICLASFSTAKMFLCMH